MVHIIYRINTSPLEKSPRWVRHLKYTNRCMLIVNNKGTCAEYTEERGEDQVHQLLLVLLEPVNPLQWKVITLFSI